MNTHLTSIEFPLFKEKRLLFKGGLETSVIADLETKSSADKKAADALEDKDKLYSDSEKEGGAVFKFMKGVEKKVNEAIPDKLAVKKTADDYKKYGNEGGKGKGIAAKAAIPALPTPPPPPKDGEEAKPTPKWDLAAAKAAAIAAAGGAKAPTALKTAINASTDRKTMVAACDTFERDWQSAHDHFEAAKKIEARKKTLLDNMKSLAITAVRSKQEAAFKKKRTEFIDSKVNALVKMPTETELKALKPEQRKALIAHVNGSRLIGTQYLEGVLSGVELTLAKDADKAFKAVYNEANLKTQLPKPKEEIVPIQYDEDPVFGSKVINPEVASYVEGLWVSKGVTKEHKDWLVERYKAIPENKKNDLATVKAYLGTMHLELSYDKEHVNEDSGGDKWEVKILPSHDAATRNRKERLAKDMDAANGIMKKNPRVRAFFRQRMALGVDYFYGKPNWQVKRRQYRNMVLSRIAQMKGKPINWTALEAIPKPDVMEAASAKMIKAKDLPKGLRQPSGLLPGTSAFALELYKILQRNNVPAGVGVPIRYKGRTYYGIYKPGEKNLYILEKPGDNPPLPTRTPKQSPKKPAPLKEQPKKPEPRPGYTQLADGRWIPTTLDVDKPGDDRTAGAHKGTGKPHG